MLEPPEETYWEHEMLDPVTQDEANEHFSLFGPDGPIPEPVIDHDYGDEDGH